jgi:proline dehydrogenase
VLRQALLIASRSSILRSASTSVPLARSIGNRFVAGETIADAVGATADVTATGRLVSLDRLGDETESVEQARSARDEYVDLIAALHANGLTAETELSVKLSALGQLLPQDGEKIALELAHSIAARAAQAGTAVTLDMEDHTTTDSTLGILRALRTEFPDTGGVLQAYLYRSEADCKDLATLGSRIRICKGAFDEPESVAYQSRHEIDLAFVRCIKVLMEGDGYPMVATHDPTLVEISQALAIHKDRPKGSYEHQMLYGVHLLEQDRLVREGERLRVYVPYGSDWYGYLMRRMAERPRNLSLMARSVAGGSDA